MTIAYTYPIFILPPRPETAIPSARLGLFEKPRQWLGQAKMNGTFNQIIVSPTGRLVCRRRDGSEHKQWWATEVNEKAFQNLPGDGYYVFSAELLNDKTKHIKNVNYLHDILVADGKLLTGTSYPERYRILCDLFPNTEFGSEAYSIIDDRTWLAKVFHPPFLALYDRLIKFEEIEGLVLKNTFTKLSLGDPSRGQIKVRRPTKNYAF